MNETLHIHERVMAHVWRSRGTYVKESCPISKPDQQFGMSVYLWTSHSTFTNESRDIHGGVTAHIHMKESWHICAMKRSRHILKRSCHILKRSRHILKRSRHILKRSCHILNPGQQFEMLAYLWSSHGTYIKESWHIPVTRLIYTYTMTHSYMCHDSFIHVPWLIHMCAMMALTSRSHVKWKEEEESCDTLKQGQEFGMPTYLWMSHGTYMK